KQSQKSPTSWTEEEETFFIDFLISEVASSGDGGFKKITFQEAAKHLKAKFLQQVGGEKTAASCQSKFQGLKKSYNVVIDIRNTSGFTWSDKNGAGIALKNNDVWDKYARKFPAVRLFKNKGFIHFHTMEQLMPSTGKGDYVFHPGQQVTQDGGTATSTQPHGQSNVPTTSLSESATGSSTQSQLALCCCR
ncbi:hypothetical protein PAXRUDRAFT_171791, partial [Paxillus rubicundulus Ve08.2h10]